jgi:hypothetical protein
MEMQQLIGMLAEMREKMETNQARLDENAKTMNEKMDANKKTTLNKIKEDMKTMQEMAEADRKREREEMKQEIRAGQEKIQEKMEEMMNRNQAKTDAKFKELTETVEKNAVGITDSRSVPRRAGKETPGRLNRNQTRVAGSAGSSKRGPPTSTRTAGCIGSRQTIQK